MIHKYSLNEGISQIFPEFTATGNIIAYTYCSLQTELSKIQSSLNLMHPSQACHMNQGPKTEVQVLIIQQTSMTQSCQLAQTESQIRLLLVT